MALITCSECGRAISDRAAACVGCGAPLASRSGISLVPAPVRGEPPTRAQIRTRLWLSGLMLAIGIVATRLASRLGGFGQIANALATLLILVGLIWLLVTLVQRLSPRE